MNGTVFADSFFYLALLNPRDEFHERVRQWSLAYRGRAVTTEAALLELGDAFCDPPERAVLLALLDELRNDALIEIVPLSPDLLRRGWRLFEERADKTWGVTDCISLTVMEERGLTQALTGDHHFTQAGFQALFAQ